ncbi:Fibroblast growth factor receptor-like 1 [Acropora cervicornis]|uniref:Fibroblast growth factor receptor-like 1 n=1 Tax=Acropora cervicornis TaxID=6130 RepID=A0AAD9QDK5_ACRCE|nr:Fibroblast growth factor receptor-like 1 [Acropora cervicornis]
MDDTMKLVGSPPTFSDQNALRILFRASLVSESIHLKCKANGTPPLTYSWLKDGHRLPTRLKVHPSLTSLNWYLRLKELRLADSGEYTCIVSNPYGSINRTYNLQVISGKNVQIIRQDCCLYKMKNVNKQIRRNLKNPAYSLS